MVAAETGAEAWKARPVAMVSLEAVLERYGVAVTVAGDIVGAADLCEAVREATEVVVGFPLVEVLVFLAVVPELAHFPTVA